MNVSQTQKENKSRRQFLILTLFLSTRMQEITSTLLERKKSSSRTHVTQKQMFFFQVLDLGIYFLCLHWKLSEGGKPLQVNTLFVPRQPLQWHWTWAHCLQCGSGPKVHTEEPFTPTDRCFSQPPLLHPGSGFPLDLNRKEHLASETHLNHLVRFWLVGSPNDIKCFSGCETCMLKSVMCFNCCFLLQVKSMGTS